ncbi:hypothetical protein Poli38472_006195 [Pythium oligandrum]|uniref:PA domain-containing protein n=1 Tax=Pythium oligandrum TaxID=41045 RepID=A0A8K1CTW8_PYTOL|nr:hypothetical protein Poli38472_006195 [Pythium oligandrum]|eukprot:TMW68727.1 hypothetical protein Poli38472_006195 [Pythium oligandrum]
MRSSRFRLVLVGLAASIVVASSTESQGLRFHVPYAFAQTQGLDLESVGDDTTLRIKRVLADTQRTCQAGAGGCHATDQGVSLHPSVHSTDRLVAVDGESISLKSFQDAIDMPPGSVVVLPLFQSSDPETNLLSGFARIEILRPKTLTLEPTSPEREAAVQTWQAAVAEQQQAALAREQEERERNAALENERLEAKACQEREKEEQSRLEITTHDRVGEKRAKGVEFRYEALFPLNGPIGLNWDLHTKHKTIVSSLEFKLPAHNLNVIAPSDQLIQLNDINTTNMEPHNVVQAYLSESPPRRLVFLVQAKAKSTTGVISDATGAPSSESQVQNWTMMLEEPAILRGWQARVHLANWSVLPTFVNQSTRLLMASPITACQPQAQVPGEPANVAYLTYRGGCSFIEKAQNVRASGAKTLVVVNNVKGEGRFPSGMPALERVMLPVNMIAKVDGELIMAVLEHEPIRFHVHEEDPENVPKPPTPARKLTNEEMVLRRNPAKAARSLTFWYINATSPSATEKKSLSTEFRILPALFGNDVVTMPYRIVMAYPQDTACHPKGLGILATRAVVLVKRGGCSFGVKAKSVEEVGGAGMLMINSDDSLLPLMSDPKETQDLTIWAARYVIRERTHGPD